MSAIDLNNTSVRFKFYSETVSISRNSLEALCKLMATSPLSSHRDIKGLLLEGDHYFRKVSLNSVAGLDELETAQVTGVTPIREDSEIPFHLTRNDLEISLPTDKLDIGKLKQSIEAVAVHFGKLTGYTAGLRIELPLRGACTTPLFNEIYYKILPYLPDGSYTWEAIVNDKMVSDEIVLPASSDVFCKSIPRIPSRVLNTPYTLRLTSGGNRIVISNHQKQELGVILSAADPKWFLKVVGLFEKQNLFPETAPEKEQVPQFGTNG
ncbi:MAG: hypothetical protein V1844_04265 [Pseudomonadota bacterium]